MININTIEINVITIKSVGGGNKGRVSISFPPDLFKLLSGFSCLDRCLPG